MVAEEREILHQEPEDQKLVKTIQSAPVKINRTSCLTGNTVSSTLPNDPDTREAGLPFRVDENSNVLTEAPDSKKQHHNGGVSDGLLSPTPGQDSSEDIRTKQQLKSYKILEHQYINLQSISNDLLVEKCKPDGDDVPKDSEMSPGTNAVPEIKLEEDKSLNLKERKEDDSRSSQHDVSIDREKKGNNEKPELKINDHSGETKKSSSDKPEKERKEKTDGDKIQVQEKTKTSKHGNTDKIKKVQSGDLSLNIEEVKKDDKISPSDLDSEVKNKNKHTTEKKHQDHSKSADKEADVNEEKSKNHTSDKRQKNDSKSKDREAKVDSDRHRDHAKSKDRKDEENETKSKNHTIDKRHRDNSKSKDGEADVDKAKSRDQSSDKRHRDQSKPKDRETDVEEDKRKDHAKQKGHKESSKFKEETKLDKNRSKNHAEKEKNKCQIKEEPSKFHISVKETESNVKGIGAKRTLVDLDLFQERQVGEKKSKTKDRIKSKSKEKSHVGGTEVNKKNREIGDDRKHAAEKHAEGKPTKREREDEEDSESDGVKKSKYELKGGNKEGPKKVIVTTSKKRKGNNEVGDTKAKISKEEKKKQEEDSRWKWWEEANYEDGVKWKFLEHKGPYFAPPYEPLPDDIRFHYDGQEMKLSLAAEEVATFYAKMLDHEYTTKEVFQNNFFTDWKEQMTKEERKTIKHLYKCDFSEIHKYFFDKNEARKALPKEEKQKLKEETSKIQEEYGYCTLDGHREKIGNFKTEPPGLFRGRGDHPKMGMLKLRIRPEDVIINCSKDSKVPDAPPGHRWKEIRFDNTVTWLASWTENIQSSIKYIMLNPSSKLKGEKDWQKYEVARRLKGVVGKIRSQYRDDWKSREMKKRQRAVALYFIDKLALRAGNEKEEGETADTVGCCSLRVEHIKLFPELDGQKHVVEFDFLGKDSIRYYNKVPVEKEVFKNLKRFMENKDPEDDLFDRLNTTTLNKHLQDLMEGLTAKVFRTYNASITLQDQLKELTNGEDNVAAKILSYNRANRAVALLCNHQRALPKTFEKSMQNLQTKIDAKEQQWKDAKRELKSAKADYKKLNTEKNKREMEKKTKQCERLEEQLQKLKLQATDKEENKQVALGTSKLNYLDPRISVAWCKKYGVPIEKIYNKTQREKFAWAIAMTDESFEF